MKDNTLVRKLLPRWEWLVGLLEDKQIKDALRFSFPLEMTRSAETDFESRKRALEYAQNRWPAKVEEIKNSLRSYLDKSVIDADSIDEDDVLFSFFAYGLEPNEYCYYGIRKDTPAEKKRAFVSSRDAALFYKSINHIIDRGNVGYKNHSYNLFKEFYHRDAYLPHAGNDFDSFRLFVQKHKHAVKKDITGQCGELVELVDFETINNLEEYYRAKVAGFPVMFEELISQSDRMAQFNKSSVNTVRFATLLIDDTLIPLFSFLKIGRSGSFVDNGAQGGIVVNVDTETGLLTTDGRSELGESFVCVPDTSIQIKGQNLPDWEQLIDLVNKAARRCKTVPYVGWDVAHTDDGWVIVEANEGGSFIVQTPLQRGIKGELIDALKRGSSKRIARTIRLLSI